MKKCKLLFQEKVIRIKAPNNKFRKTEDALDYIEDLSWDAIVLNGVYDPQSNIAILEPGESKSDFQPSEWGRQEEFWFEYNSRQSAMKQEKEFFSFYNVKFQREIPSSIQRKDKAKFLQSDLNNFEEYKEMIEDVFNLDTHFIDIQAKVGDRIANINIENYEQEVALELEPEDEYEMTLEDVKEKFEFYGEDMALDYLSWGSKEEFNDWAQSAANDFDVSNMVDSDIKDFLKAKGVRDIKGYLTNIIYDGMLKAFKKRRR